MANHNGGVVYWGWSGNAFHPRTPKNIYVIACGLQLSASVLGLRGLVCKDPQVDRTTHTESYRRGSIDDDLIRRAPPSDRIRCVRRTSIGRCVSGPLGRPGDPARTTRRSRRCGLSRRFSRTTRAHLARTIGWGQRWSRRSGGGRRFSRTTRTRARGGCH